MENASNDYKFLFKNEEKRTTIINLYKLFFME